MDQTNQPIINQPMPAPATPPVMNMPPEHKRVGPIISILIIVLILIIAALYIFASRSTPAVIPNDTTTAAQTDNTDVTSLQSDLNTSTTGLDNQNF